MVLKTRELFVRQRSQTANAMRADMAELGIVATTGMTSIVKFVAILRDGDDARLPSAARAALLDMAGQIEGLTVRIEAFDAKNLATVKNDEAARRLTTIPGVGPIIAATVRATISDPAAFRTRRDLAAWIGITPRANSSGGKERLGSISKQGNKQLRTLLIVGATSILKHASPRSPASSPSACRARLGQSQ
jgi:transposase